MRVKINWANGDSKMGSAYYIFKALNELGHEVIHPGGDNTGLDLVLNIDGFPLITPVPNVKYFYWECDSFMEKPPIEEGTYDKLFIGGSPEDLVKYPKGTIFLPHACDEELHKPIDVKKEYDIVMVGSDYDERSRLLSLLEKEGFTVGRLHTGPGLEYSEAMSKGRLIFNRSKADNIPMRFFEGMAIGCLITNDPGNLAAFAKPFTHYIPYRDDEELLNRVKFYLDEPDLIASIEVNARTHVLANHTYKHRVKEILSYA